MRGFISLISFFFSSTNGVEGDTELKRTGKENRLWG